MIPHIDRHRDQLHPPPRPPLLALLLPLPLLGAIPMQHLKRNILRDEVRALAIVREVQHGDLDAGFALQLREPVHVHPDPADHDVRAAAARRGGRE